jgi:NADH:ubiquinone oxidoreductase subunit 3 (subunit A)
MVSILLSPPIAFLLYIPLLLVIVWFGRQLAGPTKIDASKSSTYGSGEEAPSYVAAPGYKPFFLVALFFAILHLGMLVLGLTANSLTAVIYLVGLGIGLVALILG